MNELVIKDNEKIVDMIYEIRGKQVMLDSDLSKIYNVETKRINEAVKNNPKKFPEEYSFVLSDEEYNILRSKFSTANDNIKSINKKRFNPRAFTEEGCLMLGTILKSDVAVNTTLLVIEAFVAMKRFISNNFLEQNFYKNKILEHDKRIKLLEESFSTKTFSNEIFFEGQIYDAYSLLLDILDSSKESIIIIDNYANKNLFDLFSKTKKKVIVYSKNIDNELINKYKSQYSNVELKYNDGYHDRYIIIDNKILYHCGSPFKDLGKKCFCISKIDNILMIDDILNKL